MGVGGMPIFSGFALEPSRAWRRGVGSSPAPEAEIAFQWLPEGGFLEADQAFVPLIYRGRGLPGGPVTCQCRGHGFDSECHHDGACALQRGQLARHTWSQPTATRAPCGQTEVRAQFYMLYRGVVYAGDLLDPGIEPMSRTWQADSLPLSHLGNPNPVLRHH